MTGRYLALFGAVLVAACRAQEPLGGPTETLKARSRIVVVDVVAMDWKGSPVKGLKASDFQLLEDKTPQTMRHFDEHRAAADTAGAPLSPVPKMAPNMFTNVMLAPLGSALNVILIDALNTPQESQPMLRSQPGEVVDKLPANTRVAVFGLSDRRDGQDVESCRQRGGLNVYAGYAEELDRWDDILPGLRVSSSE